MTNIRFAFISMPGGGEWFWIFLIFLVLFGAAALPKLFRSLGKSVREFKKASDGLSDEMEKAAKEEDSKKEDAKKADALGKAEAPGKPEPPTKADE